MLPDTVIDLLRTQSGVAARHQIRLLEPDRSARRSIYADPHLELATPRVLRHRAVPPSTDQILMTGVLDAGPDSILWSKPAATRKMRRQKKKAALKQQQRMRVLILARSPHLRSAMEVL